MNDKPRISFEDIRERAYELWERHHRPDGFEMEFWLLAERELRADRERRGETSESEPQQANRRFA